ncbi:hypothetical protein Bbelb_001410 [Branchiostoma belcheri]|nr:hypothetical protein Bbelb_001410 [Branchiostoma belcheri]
MADLENFSTCLVQLTCLFTCTERYVGDKHTPALHRQPTVQVKTTLPLQQQNRRNNQTRRQVLGAQGGYNFRRFYAPRGRFRQHNTKLKTLVVRVGLERAALRETAKAYRAKFLAAAARHFTAIAMEIAKW